MGSELIRLANSLDLPEETVPERHNKKRTSETMFAPEPVSASSQDEEPKATQASAARLVETIHIKERLSTPWLAINEASQQSKINQEDNFQEEFF